MSRRRHWIQLAKRWLRDGSTYEEAIDLLVHDGCPTGDAEELVEIAGEELRGEI